MLSKMKIFKKTLNKKNVILINYIKHFLRLFDFDIFVVIFYFDFSIKRRIAINNKNNVSQIVFMRTICQ